MSRSFEDIIRLDPIELAKEVRGIREISDMPDEVVPVLCEKLQSYCRYLCQSLMRGVPPPPEDLITGSFIGGLLSHVYRLGQNQEIQTTLQRDVEHITQDLSHSRVLRALRTNQQARGTFIRGRVGEFVLQAFTSSLLQSDDKLGLRVLRDDPLAFDGVYTLASKGTYNYYLSRRDQAWGEYDLVLHKEDEETGPNILCLDATTASNKSHGKSDRRFMAFRRHVQTLRNEGREDVPVPSKVHVRYGSEFSHTQLDEGLYKISLGVHMDVHALMSDVFRECRLMA